jgi:acyl-coenzyme A synthetase/AMP-(fatty) acid ligase
VKARLAPFKYPRIVEFVSSLPKNDRGKIDRRRLGGAAQT